METIAIDQIILKNKYLRTNTNIDSLAKSIEQIGLINPLIVNNENELVAGARRYMALKQLGKDRVDIIRVDKNSLEQELISIDENLMRKNLTGLELEKCLARGQELYEQLNPDKKLDDQTSEQDSSPNDHKKSFIKTTANKTGMSESSIRMAIRRNRDSSDLIKQARADGELGATQTNELIQLPQAQQNQILPFIKKRPVKEVKDLVDHIKQQGIQSALEQESDHISPSAEYDNLFRMCKRANRLFKIVMNDPTLKMGSRENIILDELEQLRENVVSFFETSSSYAPLVSPVEHSESLQQ